MSLIIKCPTDKALVICGLRDNKGVFRIPIQSAELPGLEIKVDHGMPINPQLMQAMMDAIGHNSREFYIEQTQTLSMTLNSGEPCTVFLATHIGDGRLSHAEFPRLVDVLKAFPANQNRKELLKAFQYFSAGLSNDLKALTTEDLLN